MREADFYRRVVDDGPAATLVASGDGTVTYMNRRAVRVLGADFTGMRFASVFAAEHARSARAFLGEVAAAPADALVFFEGEAALAAGRLLYLHVVGANLLPDLEVAGLVLTVMDATELKRREEALSGRALTDDLTALPNRALLLDRLAELRRTRTGGALAFLDLDRFKMINDHYGHNVGDELLKICASRLLAACPDDATVGRMGGDEFVLLLPHLSLEQAAEVTRVACSAVGEPVELSGTTLTVSASAGVTAIDGPSAESVLREADSAMYAAKAGGRDTIVVAGPELATWAASRRDLAAHITALEVERRRLNEEVRTDALTRLPNRRALDDTLTHLREGVDVRSETSVLFVDIDHFGAYNKRHGDAAGDRMLQRVAGILHDACRAGDTAYRKGGEEFVIVLTDTALEEAVSAAGRVRAAVERAGLPHGGAPGTPLVTVTIGVAQWRADEPCDVAVDRAGTAAYHGKTAGLRNAVHVEPTLGHGQSG